MFFRTATLSGLYAHNLDDQHKGIQILITKSIHLTTLVLISLKRPCVYKDGVVISRLKRTTLLQCGCRRLATKQGYLGSIIMPMVTFVSKMSTSLKAGHVGSQCVMTTNSSTTSLSTVCVCVKSLNLY